MDADVQDLTLFLLTMLRLKCPVLSGNMKTFIFLEEINKNSLTISISAPSYDIALWQKTGQIQHTFKYDYAYSVNEQGAFKGKSKKSQHWVNKALLKGCEIKANEWGGEVKNELEL